MTPEVSDFIPGSLDETEKYIEVADRHHVTVEKKGQVRINMCDDNGKSFITTLHNEILAPDLYERLFSIVTLKKEHTRLFNKLCCTLYFGA